MRHNNATLHIRCIEMNEDLKVLFHKLADLSPGQREAFYRQRHVPAAARAELESLLIFNETEDDSLTGLVGSAAEQFLLSNAPVSEDGRCGPYRLVQLLGNGGMGAVYLSERADGELEQRVAIKFLRAGPDLPSFRERFLRERQILASLSHPGIARLLDVGHVRGHPYLVMEFVDGTRIDQYASGLDTREILALFLRVCEAVSFAHRNLIIHSHGGHPRVSGTPSGEGTPAQCLVCHPYVHAQVLASRRGGHAGCGGSRGRLDFSRARAGRCGAPISGGAAV